MQSERCQGALDHASRGVPYKSREATLVPGNDWVAFYGYPRRHDLALDRRELIALARILPVLQ